MITAKLPTPYQITAERLYASISTRIIAKLPDRDYAIAKSQVEGLRVFLNANIDDLGDRSFLLELAQEDDTSGSALSAALIIDANQNGPAVITLGHGLRTIGIIAASVADDSEPDEVNACDLSEGTVIAFYEQRCLVRFYVDGSTAGTLDPRAMSSRPGKYPRLSRRPEDYEDAILDHYRSRVRDWQSDHWADRQKRTLRARRGKAVRTEDIFQDSLVEWLDLHLDATVKGKVGQVTSDQTDIEINAPGKLYIIEIKWLGKNESGTPYTIKRVSEGLRQVRDYLAKQARVKHGTLVVYDGRPQKQFESLNHVVAQPHPGCKCICKCEDESVNARASCMLFFLRSTTASES